MADQTKKEAKPDPAAVDEDLFEDFPVDKGKVARAVLGNGPL